MPRALISAIAAAAATTVSLCAEPLYKDPSTPIPARVADLLGRMTLDEKIGQITGAWLLERDKFKEEVPNGVGSVGPSQELSLAQDVEFRNALQHFLVEETRLGIPAMFHDEGCHGLVKPEASSFPAPIGLACSWDPALAERIYNVVALEMRSRGAQQALAPVVDVARDPRWGRIDETMGEDPFLNARMGAAMVRGFQGSADGTIDARHVMATLKHFTGHGTPEGGLNRSPSASPARTLREVDLVPFAWIVKAARPAAVMPSYNEVDGVPSHANRRLLQDVLRREFGFDGLIVSDYGAIGLLAEAHHVAGSPADAGALALRSGVQVELPRRSCYPLLGESLAKGAVKAAQIDEAVKAVLTWKFRLGLFEHPYADAALARAAVERPESRALALEAACESIVVLENKGVLPLKIGRGMTIAVIGPNAAVARLGSYSGTPDHSVSLLEGIRARVGSDARVLHAPGCVLVKNDPDNAYASWHGGNATLGTDEENRPLIAEAERIAAQADVVVLAIGETEALSREAWENGHAGDADTLELRGSQSALAEAVFAAGKPVVVFLSNGRPLAIPRLKEKAAAILEGWYMGEETGTAAARILFGDVSPSGKLTVSVPASVGQIPAYYSKKPGAAMFPYGFSSNQPLWAFGHGLSYTRFRYENARLRDPVIPPDGATVASVDVVNSGDREADEIVQLYIHQDVSSVTRAVKELKGFERIHLKPGERRTVSLPVGPDALALWGSEERWRVEPGTFRVILGPSSSEGEAVTLTVRE